MKRLSQFYFSNRCTYKTIFFFFFHFSMFTFFIITENPRKVFFLGNIAILILIRMLPVPFEYIELFSRNYDLKKGYKYFNFMNFFRALKATQVPKKLKDSLTHNIYTQIILRFYYIKSGEKK